MNTRTRLFLASLFCCSLAAAHGQFVTVALENHNLQNGANTTAPDGTVFYATVEDVAGVTGATVSATAGTLTTPAGLADDGDYFELEENRANIPTLLTDFPLGATYTINTTGLTGTATITGPGGSYADYAPVVPKFTISGATGVWSNGHIALNPTSSFSITLNNYSVTNSGGNYAWYLNVGDSSDGYTELGEVSGDSGTYVAPTFTFTAGAPLDGGDADLTTYGFTAGSQFYFEAGFFNIIGLTNSAIAGAQQAFVAGSTTGFSMTTSAIPEPSTYAAILGGLALVGVALHRRRQRA
jgi:hypothetical protein